MSCRPTCHHVGADNHRSWRGWAKSAAPGRARVGVSNYNKNERGVQLGASLAQGTPPSLPPRQCLAHAAVENRMLSGRGLCCTASAGRLWSLRTQQGPAGPSRGAQSTATARKGHGDEAEKKGACEGTDVHERLQYRGSAGKQRRTSCAVRNQDSCTPGLG